MTCLAVDFGGTRIKLGLVRSQAVVAQKIIPAESQLPLLDRLEVVAGALEDLCHEQNILVADCVGVGFSYPSIIDRKNAKILDHFGKFGDARTLDLRKWSMDRLGIPLAIDNDARMALIGEWRYGAGRGSNNCVIVTLGTGIGVSAVIEGQVLRGVHGQAGILGGHITIDTDGGACVCGNVGCAELAASTSVIAKTARARADFASSALAHEPVLDYATVFRLAKNGDALSLVLRDESLKVWSALAVNLIHVFDPELLIFSGGVMGSGEMVLEPIREYVSRHAHTPWGNVKIMASTLGEQAPLLACEWLISEELQGSY